MNNFVAYSKIYKDYNDLYSTDINKFKVYCNILFGLTFILTIASLVWFLESWETKYSDALSLVTMILLAILVMMPSLRDWLVNKLSNHNLNSLYLEGGIELKFDYFKYNYRLLDNFIKSMRSRDRYALYLVSPSFKFSNEQYIDIILNKFYNNLDKEYYSVSGSKEISLYGDDLVSLDNINAILGDCVYGYSNVVDSLKK